MKTKLLLLSLLIVNVLFAQFPTSGLVGYYDFTNGSFLDQANGNNFTQTGTALINVNDRFSAANNAVELNGDYLTRADIPISGTHTFTISYSFWVKTSTNNSNLETIIDDSSRNTVTHFDSDDVGYYIYLHEGKIKLTSRFYTRLMFGSPIEPKGYGHSSSKFIADGNWHHVVVEFKTYILSGIQKVTSKIYIDSAVESNLVNHNGIVTSPNTTGNVTIANSRTNHLTATNQYKDAIDDILIYDRSLTQAEVTQLATINNFCLTPSNTIFSINNITNTTADIAISQSGTFDVAYHKTGEAFSSATILSGITSGTVNLTGLEENSSYDVYVREQCTSNTTGWSASNSFTTTRTIGVIYVNHAATGNNNGVSWANAYTSLNDALTNVEANEQIWVAQGTYTPHASDRTASFILNDEGIKLYGGFTGTETAVSQRDFRANVTILSGDLSANDDTTLAFTNTTRNDNSYHVVEVNANNTLINGFTITGAFANGTGDEATGGAIFKGLTVPNFDIYNCVLKNNIAVTAASAIFSRYSANGTLKVHNCSFNNNLARYGTSIYSYTDNNITATVEVANSLFYNNQAVDNGGNLGYAGSAGWYRAYGTSSAMNVTLANNTYANNIDTGTASSLNNFSRGTVGMGYTNGVLTANLANNIFWGNTTAGGATTRSIAQIHTTLGQNITITNSTAQDSFANIPSGGVSNTLSTDPSFVDAVNGDFTLNGGSSSIDSGDNVSVVGVADLLGKVRIYNTTVDRGAFEFGSTTLGTKEEKLIKEFTLYPNPASEMLYISINTDLKKIEIFGIRGNKITEVKSKESINISSLSSGIYLVKLTTLDNKVGVSKFVKK